MVKKIVAAVMALSGAGLLLMPTDVLAKRKECAPNPGDDYQGCAELD